MNENLDIEDVIENDNEEDLYENGGIYPYDPTKKDIDIREEKFSVYELIIRKKDDLILDPDFQRNYVWGKDIKKQSQFIESILLNFPLTPIFLNQDIYGKLIVVDGKQRITTLQRFLSNEFKLTGLNALPQLNGLNFTDLINFNKAYKAKIEAKLLSIQVIKPSVPLQMVYDIFNRINDGGLKLERQEFRNCIFIGKSTILLKEIALMPEFSKAIESRISDERMKLREAALRIISFCNFNFKEFYTGDMSDYIEDKMKKINMIKDEVQLDEIKYKFKRIMILTYDFFGEKNFRIPTKDTKGRINIALMESVCYFFWNNSDEFLKSNKTKIKNNFKVLLKDNEFIDAISRSTGSKNRVFTRFNKAMEILGNIN